MDIENLQQAQLGFDAYVEQRSRVAETVPPLLMQNEIEFEQLCAKETSHRNNHGLLADFTQMLPTAEDDSVLAGSVSEARQLQAGLMWLEWSGAYDRASTYHPFYIVGACPATEKEYTDKKTGSMHVLLSSARPRNALRNKPDNSLAVLTVREDEFTAITHAAQARKEHGYGNRIPQMFDKPTRKLRITRVDQESIRTCPVNGTYDIDKSRPSAELVKRVTKYGLSACNFRTYDSAISDEDMVCFDVFAWLNQLAVDFGQEEDYRSLLGKHLQKAEELAAIREART